MYQEYPFPSRRTCVYGNAICASSSPWASQAGLEILQKGGNAIDAAIAMASTLTVTEPTCNGLGSDMFALIWKDEKLYGYNGSGKSPKALDPDILRNMGLRELPLDGVIPITVPGAVKGWYDIWEKFGKLSFEECFEPAIHYGKEGFIVTPQLAILWEDSYRRFGDKKESIYQPWKETFAPKGRAPREGERFVNKDIAKTLEIISKTKTKDFYHGKLADKIVDTITKAGGYLRKEDLENHKGLWVQPLKTTYRGVDIWELPPNGHGITVLMTLQLLEELPLETMSEELSRHYTIEALKLAYTDVREYVADPDHMICTPEQLLHLEYSNSRRKLLEEQAQEAKIGTPPGESTVYFAVADEEGTMVSWIQSNYEGFGSGVVIPGTSIACNDRGANFNLRKGHANEAGGGKRSYHTIIPGFMTKDGKAFGAFGVMGGFMQPQGQVQVIRRLLDDGYNPQAALDAPRWQWLGGLSLEVEEDMNPNGIKDLKTRGHDIQMVKDSRSMGRGQIILKTKEGYVAGTEKRTDGSIYAR
ncbi:MAG: gamma-glutamyltransferase family protein [Tissierellia bacterium]|nr:gamma-glutamyltransferase family protein [Tissierellia bacterium]